MLRKFSNLAKYPQYSSVAKPLKISDAKKLSPLITCKKQTLNLLPSQVAPETAKFGSIPLASKGWSHRKAKGDFFIIHPTNNDEINVNIKLTSIKDLEQLQIQSNLIVENLKNEFEIENLTELQSNVILKANTGNHILIAAETGCGKTLAYLIPLVDQIIRLKPLINSRQLNTPLILILTPGRELATQIADVAAKLVKGSDIKVKSILGGNTKQKMINPHFEEVDILVASIGAISKLVTTGIYRMHQVRHVVLDEADTLLDDSFSDKLCYFLNRFAFYKNNLLQDLNSNIVGTQLILASATMPTNINELLANVVDTDTIKEVVSPNLHKLLPYVRQKFLRMNKSDRPSQLVSLAKSELKKNRPLIIFGNKSATSDFISIFLNDSGVNCLNLNGDMLMKIRIGRFEQFQRGEVDVLATTDVASRGLDTTRARHVINFDFPLHVSDYIHRCGRIGRIGSVDNCFVTNFVSSQREISLVQHIEHAARSGGLLPNVNANITNLIHKRILKDIGEDVNVF